MNRYTVWHLERDAAYASYTPREKSVYRSAREAAARFRALWDNWGLANSTRVEIEGALVGNKYMPGDHPLAVERETVWLPDGKVVRHVRGHGRKREHWVLLPPLSPTDFAKLKARVDAWGAA